MRTPTQIFRKILGQQLNRNIASAGLQAIISVVSMFFAYRALVQEVGLEKMGLWSLLISGVSIARLMDITGAGGLGRFVAEARSENLDTRSYIHTVTLATLALYALLGIFFVSFSGSVIEKFVGPENIDEAVLLLPFALIIGLLLTPLSATLTSGVDGLGRADFRSVLVTISNILFLSIVFVFVGDFGVWAWGAATIAQHIFVIVGAWAILRAYVPGLGFCPSAWSYSIFRETFAYGLKLQANSVASMLSDPLSKFILNHFGGLAAVSLYELGSRFVLAPRSIFVQMGTPLIPEFASNRRDKEAIGSILKRALAASATFSTVMCLGVVILSPVFSLFMLGEINLDLIVTSSVLGVAHGFNVLAIPYYYCGLGLNILRWNVSSQVLMAACILVLGVPLGESWGSFGVLFAVSIGVVGGAIMVMVGNKHSIGKVAINNFK